MKSREKRMFCKPFAYVNVNVYHSMVCRKGQQLWNEWFWWSLIVLWLWILMCCLSRAQYERRVLIEKKIPHQNSVRCKKNCFDTEIRMWWEFKSRLDIHSNRVLKYRTINFLRHLFTHKWQIKPYRYVHYMRNIILSNTHIVPHSIRCLFHDTKATLILATFWFYRLFIATEIENCWKLDILERVKDKWLLGLRRNHATFNYRSNTEDAHWIEWNEMEWIEMDLLCWIRAPFVLIKIV